jgi:ribosomal protein S14
VGDRKVPFFDLPLIYLSLGSIKLTRAVSNRQALRYIIRNLSLPPRTRAQAQLQLADMHAYTRSTQIRNRCIEGGKGRGILRDFKMSRVGR